MAYERWKQVVYDKNITEEESLAFYTTWANHVRLCYTKSNHFAGTFYLGCQRQGDFEYISVILTISFPNIF